MHEGSWKKDTGSLSYVLYRTQSGTKCRCHGNTEQVMDYWTGTEEDLRFTVFLFGQPVVIYSGKRSAVEYTETQICVSNNFFATLQPDWC